MIPPSAQLQRADGSLSLRFCADGAGVTRLVDLYQSDPCRALLPRPDPGEASTAVLITTAGGLTGGDHLRIDIAVDAGADALCTPQAAEKIYRAVATAAAGIDVTVQVADGARLEWLPQEMILFDGARLLRHVRIELAATARLLAGDMTVFGRIARGERFGRGLLFDRWQLRRAGRLIWTDAARLDGAVAATRDHPAGYHGAVAQALILYAGPELRDQGAGAACRDELRTHLAALGAIQGGVTLLEGMLLLRLLDQDTARLRRSFAGLWSALRPRLGRPAEMPRLWRL